MRNKTGTRTRQQNARLHWLLGEMNADKELKQSLIYQFTNGETTHSSEMSYQECDALILHLQKTTQQSPDSMRKKILALCHQMNWYQRDPQGNLILKNGKPMLSYAKINNFCQKYGHAHKPFNRYTRQELPTLVTQFQNLFKSSLNSK